ncbi:MAG: hypothetical protein ACI957_004665, partial [Verrucomicrobiales bacterium]
SVSSKRIILAFNDRAKWPIYITCLFTNLYAGQYSIISSIILNVPRPTAGLEKANHDWIEDLEDTLGLDPGETPDPSADSDDDGLEDITEFFLGSDPFSGSDGSPVDVRVVNLQGIWHSTVMIQRRTNAFGIEAGIQGSANGTDWAPATTSLRFTKQNSFLLT